MQIGDFNVVRRHSERLEGFDHNAATDFNNTLDFINMDDMFSKGFWYIWSNKQGGSDDRKSQLDRAVVNTGWPNDFLDSEVCVEALGISDHCPLVVSVIPEIQRRRPSKIFNFWMHHKEFKSTWVSPSFLKAS